MQKWFTDQLLVSSIALFFGATTPLILSSSGSSAALAGSLAGGTAGTVGATVLKKRKKDDVISELKYQVAATNSGLTALSNQLKELQSHALKTEQHNTTTNSGLTAISNQLKELQSNALKSEQHNTTTHSELKERSEQVQTLTTSPEETGKQESQEDKKPLIFPSGTEKVIAWLTEKNVNVQSYNQQSSADDVFDKLAVFLGERYDSLAELHQKIKRSLLQEEGTKFYFNLSNKTQKEIANCTQFCQKLYESSLLTFYHYNRKEKVIKATPTRRGDIINFFNGLWFERFIYRKVSKFLSSKGLKYQCLINPIIRFSNNNEFELDLIFFVNDQPLWIECKTGDNYNSCFQKYSEHQQNLGIAKEKTLLVILNDPNNRVEDQTKIWNITVANEINFIDKITKALGLSETKETQQHQQPVTTTLINLSQVFNKTNLRPLPEYRETVIRELIQIFEASNQPITLNQVKDNLVEKLTETTQISRTKLNEILKAVRRSNCFLDPNGNPVLSSNEPISVLVSLDAASLESKCIESYARIAISINPNYFDNRENVQEFEETVGGKVPDSKTIDQLKANVLTHSQQKVSELRTTKNSETAA